MLLEQGSARLPERHHRSAWRFRLTSASIALCVLTELLHSPQYSHVWGGTQLLLELRIMMRHAAMSGLCESVPAPLKRDKVLPLRREELCQAPHCKSQECNGTDGKARTGRT